jgi:membrane protease YdiL (CAAX protease family)
MSSTARQRLELVLFAALPTLAVAIGASLGFDKSRAGKVAGYFCLTGPTFLFAAIAVARRVSRGEAKPFLVPRWGDLSLGFFVALASFFASFGVVRLLVSSGKAIWISRIYDQAGDTTVLRDHMVLVAVAIVAAALGEELVWRGLVRDTLTAALGRRRAWIASACLYALAHVATLWKLGDEMMGKNPLIVGAALGAGLVFGALVERTGRLAPAVVAHAVVDWTVIVLFRLYGNSV